MKKEDESSDPQDKNAVELESYTVFRTVGEKGVPFSRLSHCSGAHSRKRRIVTFSLRSYSLLSGLSDIEYVSSFINRWTWSSKCLNWLESKVGPPHSACPGSILTLELTRGHFDWKSAKRKTLSVNHSRAFDQKGDEQAPEI